MSKKNRKSIVDSGGLNIAGDNNKVRLSDKETILFLQKELENFRAILKEKERHINELESLNTLLSKNLMRINRKLLFKIFSEK